jgi:hypothetical protein
MFNSARREKRSEAAEAEEEETVADLLQARRKEKGMKATATAMAGLSLDSRVGNKKMAPRSPRGGGADDPKPRLGKSLSRGVKPVEELEDGEEWEEATEDEDAEDEAYEQTKQVEAASRIFYKAQSVAELLNLRGNAVAPSPAPSPAATATATATEGAVTLTALAEGEVAVPAAAAVPTAAAAAAHEERLNELVKRRQEMVRLEAKLKGLEEALTTERTELRRLEKQLPPAADRFTTLIASKSSTALLQLRDEQLAAKADKERRRQARADKKKRAKAKEAKRKASDAPPTVKAEDRSTSAENVQQQPQQQSPKEDKSKTRSSS